MNDTPLKLCSMLTCPLCGLRATENMPTDACQYFYDCQGCGGHCQGKGDYLRGAPNARRTLADFAKLFGATGAGKYAQKPLYLVALTVPGGYIAQQLAPPSERRIKIDGVIQSLKLDVRLYTYAGYLLLAAARV